MRRLVIAIDMVELLALTACGYALAEDRELMAGIAWARPNYVQTPIAAPAAQP